MENYYVKQDFGSGGGGNRWEMNEMIVKRSFVAPTSVLAKPVVVLHSHQSFWVGW